MWLLLLLLLPQVVSHLGLPTSLLEELAAVTCRTTGGLPKLAGQKRQAGVMEVEPTVAPAMRLRQVGQCYILYSLDQRPVFVL